MTRPEQGLRYQRTNPEQSLCSAAIHKS